jgi:hypothetical protein
MKQFSGILLRGLPSAHSMAHFSATFNGKCTSVDFGRTIKDLRNKPVGNDYSHQILSQKQLL